MDRVRITNGEHKDKIGILTGVYWASGMCTVKFDDGKEIGFKLNQIATSF